MSEKTNSFFCLQKRRGHGDGRGLAAMVIGTLDNIRDSRPPPYRILLQTVCAVFNEFVVVVVVVVVFCFVYVVVIQWNLRIKDTLGPVILSFVERLSSFEG